VNVELADGSHVQGKMLGHFLQVRGRRVVDVGMLRLDDRRNWPAATLGSSTKLQPKDLCLALSYPNVHSTNQPPLLRLGRYIGADGGALRVSCRIEGGDSGGPLFDLQGRVVGVASSSGSVKWAQNSYVRVEDFVRYRDRLLAGEEIGAEVHVPVEASAGKSEAPWGAFVPAPVVARKIARAARQATVEIVAGSQVVALGVLCESNGEIVTKHSEVVVTHPLRCRLADGRLFDTRVIGASVEQDLALLKIDAQGLPAAEWAESGPQVGQLIASVGLGVEPLHVGIVGQPSVRTPRMQGVLSIREWETAPGGGARIKAMPSISPEGNINMLLQVGDIITHFDDVPIRTAEELSRARDQREAGPGGVSGERAKVTVQRGAQTMEIFVPLSPSRPYFFSALVPVSFRRSAFTNAFTHDGGALREQCGGPVVDLSGKIVGINIARADGVQTLALPASTIRRTFALLKEEAAKGQ
jgi:S1-C subfamily serine protease